MDLIARVTRIDDVQLEVDDLKHVLRRAFRLKSALRAYLRQARIMRTRIVGGSHQTI